MTQTLTNNTWYDAGSNILKSVPAGSEAFTKSMYDVIGRPTASYVGYYSGSGGDNPDSVANDVIFEETQTSYDLASNVLHTTTKERWHDATGNGSLNGPSGSQPKSRDSYVAMLYDGIGRTVATANYGTNADAGPPTWPTTVPGSSSTLLVNETSYNTKGEVEDQTDPAGRVTHAVYDAAGRVTSTTRNYGSSPTEVVGMTYNADGQVATLTAVNSDTGNQVTTYSYGVTLSDSGIASNLLLSSVDYPDGGDVDYEYNRQGQRIRMEDPNGTVHEYTYDLFGRMTEDHATQLGVGIDDSVIRITWSYDNRKRLYQVSSYDSPSGYPPFSVVEYAYDDFSQLLSEQQSDHGITATVEYTRAAGTNNSNRLLAVTYPDATVLEYGYSGTAADKLSRVSGLTWDSTQVATYDYLGLGQVTALTYPEPSSAVVQSLDPNNDNTYSGLDRFGRIIDLKWQQSSTELVHLKYGYDLVSNRTYRRDEVSRSLSEAFDELYLYDGLHRLSLFGRGTLNSTNDGLVSATLAQSWTLDASGNWKGFNQGGAPVYSTTRSHNTVNEITGISTTFGSPTWDTPPGYDPSGNLTEFVQPGDVASTLHVERPCGLETNPRMEKVAHKIEPAMTIQHRIAGIRNVARVLQKT